MGVEVELIGLDREEFNGLKGHVETGVNAEGMFQLKLTGSGASVIVSPKNLRIPVSKIIIN